MPSKQSSRTRTRTHSREQHQQPRAWGTRFDSLNASPPPVQVPSPVPSPATSPTPGDSSEKLTHALSLELFGENAKLVEKRDWADDDVPSALLSPSRAPLVLDIAGGCTPGRKDAAKQPHDASVFIGSLPPDMDEAEVAQLLAQHLAPFANVQNIKIVHDSKGGLCAFVQCENATQATQLVTQAQASPQPFTGRHLRYENARARRTLWISYRTPLQFMPCASQDEEGSDIIVNDNGVKGRWIESDLPDALRIWKPRDARFPIVTFRSEARNVGDTSRFDKDVSPSNVAPAFRPKGVLFANLKFDAQTIKRMAEAFGPLESFKLYSTGRKFGDESNIYPVDHDAVRSPGMDLGVWEIKWAHRDDCITALNTFRRVPHLGVTWAKDSASPQTPRAGLMRTPISSQYPASYSPREAISPIARGRPFLLLDCNHGHDGGFRSVDSPSSASTTSRSPNVLSPQKGPVRLAQSLSHQRDEPAQRIVEGDDIDDGWTVVRPQTITRAILSSLSGSATRNPGNIEGGGNVPEWSEGDFPPLKIGPDVPEQVKADESSEEMPSSPTFISLNDPAPPSPVSAIDQKAEFISRNIHQDDASQGGDTQNLSRPLNIHRRSLSNPVARLQVDILQDTPTAQPLDVPPTPEPANASTSQTPTSTQPDPQSPISPVMVQHSKLDIATQLQKPHVQCQSPEIEGAPSDSGRSTSSGVDIGRGEHQRQATVDPKTVFVGGLEPYGPRPWNESRLREIFEKYGDVQEVRIVNPMSKKAGFAFVTFVDEHSTLKAIREEHNRSYDGRQIRVQIRDMYPPRGGFKYRGRGLCRRPFGSGHHPNVSRIGGQNHLMLSRAGQPFGHQLGHAGAAAPFRVSPYIDHQLVPSTSAETDSATLHSSSSFDAKPELDASQETDSKTAVSVTPPPSALSTAAPITPQSLPSAQTGYYPPRSWASPYGAPMYYPIPYGGYGGMMPPIPMQLAPSSQGAEPVSVSGAAQVQWGPMYGATFPFTPFPYTIMPPNTEVPRSETSTSQPPTPVKDQPPLHATGFIQGQHGTLIPVYHPEALNNYMSSSSPTQNVAGALTSTSGSYVPLTSQQYQSLVAAQMWNGYPHAPQFIAYPVPPMTSASVPSLSASPPSSVQAQMGHQQTHGQPLRPPNSSSTPYMSPAGAAGAYPGQQQQQHSVTFTGHATSTARMLPPYLGGTHPSAAGVPPAVVSRGSEPHFNQAAHIVAPQRSNTYSNRHPPRRDLAVHQGRFGQGQGHGHVSNISGMRSPSAVRSANRSMDIPRADHHQNNSFEQRQRHPHPPAITSLQLGFNKHIQDGGYSQHQQQWITNYQQ